MVIVAAVRLALSLGGEPIVVVVLFPLAVSAAGAVILISGLLSVKHRDRLSSATFRGLAWAVGVLAATAPLLLATTG